MQRPLSRRLLALTAGLAALALALAGAAVALHPRLGPERGTLLLLASARSPTSFELAGFQLHSSSGWRALPARFNGRVPAAPESVDLAQVELPTGSYDALRLGGLTLSGDIRVQAGRVLPVLVEVEEGQPRPEGFYIGNEGVNLALAELAGRLKRMPEFSLLDQRGQPFTNRTIAGHEVVLAAFHITCTVTCPLYTGLFFQLQPRLPASVMLVEATTDPWHDTPQALARYADQVGATWTFVTGSPEQMEAFWKPFDVQLSGEQLHTSTAALIDSHGYIRSYYRGVPDLNGELPGVLEAGLSFPGYQELQSHGDGWGAAQVLDSLRSIELLGQRSSGGGEPAPDFSGRDLWGRPVSLASFRGHPILINFWASYCAPCRSELPLLQETARQHPGLRVVLVDERDNAAAAGALLAQLGIQLPVVADPDGQIGTRYGVAALPSTVFVHSDGVVEGRHVGQLDRATLADHLATLVGSRG